MENIKKPSVIRVPAKASIWYIASSALSRSIGVMGTPIFTRLLTPAEYGLFPLYNTWLGLFTVIVTLELTNGIIYRGFQKYENKKDEFTSSAFGLFTVVFIGFCALYFAFSRFLNEITGLNTFITFLMFMQIFANTTIAFYMAKAKYEYKYKNVAFLNILSSFGIPLISILLVLAANIRAEARIIGSALVLILIALPIGYSILRSSGRLFDFNIWKFLLKSNLPLIPHYLSMALILRIGEITVGRVHGTEALGKYSVALSVGMSLTVITNGLLSALTPWMLRKIRNGDTPKIRDFLLMLTKGLSALSLVILSFAPEVISVLTPDAFRSILPAVYPLEIAVVPMFLSNALVSGEMYYEKSAISALPSIISAAISAVLSLLVLPRIDYRFVSVFVLISYIVLAVLNALTFKRMSGESPVHIRKSSFVFLLTVLYAALLFLFRNVFMSRVILVLPIIPILFTLGKDIWREIREK